MTVCAILSLLKYLSVLRAKGVDVCTERETSSEIYIVVTAEVRYEEDEKNLFND